MSCAKQLILSRPANGAGIGHLIAGRRLGTWLGVLGLLICLLGCQPRVNKSPALPPPVPAAAPLPRPVHPTFYVTVNHLRLRACPGKDCPENSTLEFNTEVEKLGEIEKWTQIRVKKDGTIGYVSSRYLAPHPVATAKPARKKPKLAKRRKATQPHVAAKAEGEAAPQLPEPSPPLPHVM
jgi:hypothetical protein